MVEEINIQRYGMVSTGNEDLFSPRKEYRLDNTGKLVLSLFFNMPITNELIWLTSKTINDLLIFNAFAEGFKYVIADPNSDDVTTLYATDGANFIHEKLETASGVYINPKLFLPTKYEVIPHD